MDYSLLFAIENISINELGKSFQNITDNTGLPVVNFSNFMSLNKYEFEALLDKGKELSENHAFKENNQIYHIAIIDYL